VLRRAKNCHACRLSESHGLDPKRTCPKDWGQTPADSALCWSFSDSDLGAFAAGWHRAEGGLPSLRLANLVALENNSVVGRYLLPNRPLRGAKAVWCG